MKITILSVGNIKEKYLKDAISEYSKRKAAIKLKIESLKYITFQFFDLSILAFLDS